MNVVVIVHEQATQKEEKIIYLWQLYFVIYWRYNWIAVTNFPHQDVHYVDYMEYILLKSLEDWFAVRSSHDNEAREKISCSQIKVGLQ